MAVDPKRQRRIRVTKEVGDRADIDPSTDELGGREMAEVVEADVRCANGLSDTNEEARHLVRAEGHRGLDAGRKHEGIRRKFASGCLCQPGSDLCERSLQQRYADDIESDLPGAVGQGGLLLLHHFRLGVGPF